MTAPLDEERRARQALLHAGDPGDQSLARFVRQHGVVEAEARLRAGSGPSRDGRHTHRLLGADLIREQDLAERVGARLICPGDPEWPAQRLSRLAVPPHGLWVRGRTALEASTEKSVAVVGSRAATAYGEHVATELASGLADHGWAVVSGAAYGIDGAAHRGCLAVGGFTVAVLAGGVDDAYPKGHAHLLTRVAEAGLVVSELPVGQTPTRARFLERNRLIAALACGTVAVEMANRSGARNTLEHAETLLRPVMAVPGPVTSAMSAGCNEWIAQRRAEVVTDAEDILRIVSPVGVLDDPVRRGPGRRTDQLSGDALTVYEALPPVDRMALAELPRAAGLPAATVGDALRELLHLGAIQVAGATVSRARPTRGEAP